MLGRELDGHLVVSLEQAKVVIEQAIADLDAQLSAALKAATDRHAADVKALRANEH